MVLIMDESVDIPESLNLLCDELITSYCICAAYYYISSKVIKNSDDSEIIEEYKRNSNNAINVALEIYKLCINGENAQELILNRFKKLLIKMNKAMKNINNDISILANYYDKHCKFLIENSNNVLKKCADKAFESRC